MIIQPGFIDFLMRLVAVAGTAVRIIFFLELFSMNMVILAMGRLRRIATTRNIVLYMSMAGRTGEIFADRIHMHIEFTLGHGQRIIHIAMLDAVAAATEKMTGAAGITAGFIDLLCNVLQVYSIFWMTGFTRRFAVCARTVMAYQAVNTFLRGKIEGFVFPAITYMTGRAVGKIRLRRDTEIIQNIALAKPLLVVGI